MGHLRKISIILYFCVMLFSFVSHADERDDYLVIMFEIEDSSSIYKFFMSDTIKVRLKSEDLVCAVKKDDFAMNLVLWRLSDDIPGGNDLAGSYWIRITLTQIPTSNRIARSLTIAEGHKNIMNTLQFLDNKYYMSIFNARFDDTSLSDMSELPIYPSEDELEKSTDGEIGCIFALRQ